MSASTGLKTEGLVDKSCPWMNAHKIRSRGVSDEVYIDMHIVVDPQISVFDGHEIASQVQRRILAAMPEIKEVHVHVEPDGLSS